MIWLTDLITENNEDDINVDLWEDWREYLDYNRYEIPKEELIKLKNKFHLNTTQYLNVIIKLSDNKKSEYVIYDPSNQTFEYIRDIKDWIYKLDDSEMETLLGHSVDTIYNGWLEGTLDDLKIHPGKLYHYTTEEKWEDIQQSGELRGSSGTGITNKYAHGIFTSVDPEEYASGTYGNICLEIDMDAFKQANMLSKVNLLYEPDIEEYLLRDSIRYSLKLDDMEIQLDSTGGMSFYTIIVQHIIPIQFIKQIE